MADISKISMERIDDLVDKIAELNAKITSVETTINQTISQMRYVSEAWSQETEWYRVWSDGWIEQGGESIGGGGETIIFKKPFLTANYTTLVTPLYYKEVTIFNFTVISKSPTQMTLISGDNSGAGVRPKNWYACGY